MAANDSNFEVDPEQFSLELFSGNRELIGFKNDRHSMEYPFFSLKKTGEKLKQVFEDQRSGIKIEIRPDPELGSATIYDKDILIYLGTLMRKALDEGREVPTCFSFVASDLLKAVGRGTSGRDYNELEVGLLRLRRTGITTNIKSGGKIDIDEFSLIQRIARRKNEKTGRIERVTIVVGDWFYRAVQTQEVLSVNRAYFDLGPYERRVYEIIRKHCGDQPIFSIGIERLYEKSGSTAPLKKFTFNIKKIIGPDYFQLVDYFLVYNDKEKKVHAFSDSQEGRAALAKALSRNKNVRQGQPRAIQSDVENPPDCALESHDQLLT